MGIILTFLVEEEQSVNMSMCSTDSPIFTAPSTAILRQDLISEQRWLPVADVNDSNIIHLPQVRTYIRQLEELGGFLSSSSHDHSVGPMLGANQGPNG